MRSQSLDLSKYKTDKIQHGYLKIYDRIFSDYIDKEINLLELGILVGGSMLLWRDYFPKGRVFGIDLNAPQQLNNEERIKVFSGAQQDPSFLAGVANNAPDGFDIIIDDASHIGTLTKASFWYLFDHHLKPGGVYVIEDWGTGYWGDWPDGEIYNSQGRLISLGYKFLIRFGKLKGEYFPNHPFGMVGFVKELVDEQGAADVSRKYVNGKVVRISKFESITLTSAMVIIHKCGSAENKYTSLK